MNFCKLIKIIAARHRAIVTHDFADHPGGSQASQTHQVNGTFRMTTTLENAAFNCAQRKDMAGHDDVTGLCFGIAGSGNGACTISS